MWIHNQNECLTCATKTHFQSVYLADPLQGFECVTCISSKEPDINVKLAYYTVSLKKKTYFTVICMCT